MQGNQTSMYISFSVWLRRSLVALPVLGAAACGGGGSSEGLMPQTAPTKTAQAVANQPIAAVTGITKLSETRVSRTVYDYVFRVTVQGGPAALTGVALRLVEVGQGTAVIDGEVLVGELAAGASKTPEDTITLRVDRNVAFNQPALKWEVTGTKPEVINGISVPPLPDASRNSATLWGVDVNSNGIRDDIDRRLALDFGQNSSDYDIAVKVARSLQITLTVPTAENVAAHISSFICLDDDMLKRLSAITSATIDTVGRGRAFALAFGGVVISNERCAK